MSKIKRSFKLLNLFFLIANSFSVLAFDRIFVWYGEKIQGQQYFITIYRDQDCELTVGKVGCDSCGTVEVAKQVKAFGIIPNTSQMLVFYEKSFAIYDLDRYVLSEPIICPKKLLYSHKVNLILHGDILTVQFKGGSSAKYDLKNSCWIETQAQAQTEDCFVVPANLEKSKGWSTWRKAGLAVGGVLVIAACVALLKHRYPGAFAKLW